MAFVRAGDIVRAAYRNKQAVAAFNVFNYETIQGAIMAADSLGLPVLIEFYPGWKTFIPLDVVAEITRRQAERVAVPVGLHLDHCGSVEGIREALEAGFPSVMYDGSRLSFEENLANTGTAVELARAYGADVEAELGHVGSGGSLSDISDTSHFTDPVLAERFVRETGAGSLAVSIGNGHGNYVRTPDLDMARLREINRRLGIPLVLHGGSGIPDEQVRAAVQQGVAKMNVATDYHQACYRAVEDVMGQGQASGHMFLCAEKALSRTQAFLTEKIRLLHGLA
jgi:ketose-bisphosphate aldolase